MQNGLKWRVIKKTAQISILDQYWDNLLVKLEKEATKLKDNKSKRIISKLQNISLPVKMYVLEMYLK